MEEMRQRAHRQKEVPPMPPASAAAAPAAAGGNVHVMWGSMIESLELGDMSVREVFRMLRAPFNIAPTVAALVNGDPVDGEHVLREGDELEFTRPAGEKGRAA